MHIGAAWLKETKEGKKFFSCIIETPGLHLNFAIFKNEKKEKDNQPDYHIIWSPAKKKNDNSDNIPFEPSEENIPF